MPEQALSSEGKVSPINEKGLVLKKRCFPLPVDNSYDYLDLAVVCNREGSGIAQRLSGPNAEIFRRAGELVSGWRRSRFEEEEAARFYRWIDEFLGEYYRREFGL